MAKRRARDTFDAVSDAYTRARPGYPPALVERLVTGAGLTPASRILEVGCGTGQLTVDLLARGLSVRAVEKGERLAAAARTRCAGSGRFAVTVAAFEDADLDPGGTDLVVAAQSFHWVPVTRGLAAAADTLVPGGTFALLANIDDSRETAFYRATDPVYARFFPPPVPGDAPRDGPPDLGTAYRGLTAALRAHPEFGPVEVAVEPWQKTWDRAGYLDLVTSYSPTQLLAAPDRAAFLAALGEVIDRFGGRVTRRFRGTLITARRR